MAPDGPDRDALASIERALHLLGQACSGPARPALPFTPRLRWDARAMAVCAEADGLPRLRIPDGVWVDPLGRQVARLDGARPQDVAKLLGLDPPESAGQWPRPAAAREPHLLHADAGTCAWLAHRLTTAHDTLAAASAGRAEATPIWIRPRPLEVGFDLVVSPGADPDGSDAKRISLGWSARARGSHWFVAPWPYPETATPRPLRHGGWSRSGWLEARLPDAAAGRPRQGQSQRDARRPVLEFLRDAEAEALRLTGCPVRPGCPRRKPEVG